MSATETDRQAEIERLHARVAALEAELLEQAERAGRAVAAAQERAYWLDRWHLDLNALMRKPGAAQVRGLMRAMRAVARALKQVKRTLTRQS
ncbi:MAG TPA: hypothetical protein VFF79_04600 [Conexibacter sp.]|jgi:hypothetical protein|nr:hypothetical protein [Conexibacter sp.]